MEPKRKKTIREVLIEEYYWNGKLIVYVDHHITDETFEQACEKASK